MVDIVAGCKRGYNWFKGILKAVWELLKKLFPRPRKSSGKNSGKNSGKSQKKQNCGDQQDDSGQNDSGEDGDGNQECDGSQSGGNNGDESNGSCDSANKDATEESENNADVSGTSTERSDQIRSAQDTARDKFHRRVEEAEERGEFDTVDTEEYGAIEDPNSNEEAFEESEELIEESDELGKSGESGSGGSDEFYEPTITGKKLSMVEAALAEAFTNEETSDEETVITNGTSSGSEVELIDTSELQNARRLTVIPNQRRETRAVYD
ncbi:MAG: hypothetical protein WC877_00795 [Dehalococcoidales bacterium]|jgi:hypothetical protein